MSLALKHCLSGVQKTQEQGPREPLHVEWPLSYTRPQVAHGLPSPPTVPGRGHCSRSALGRTRRAEGAGAHGPEIVLFQEGKGAASPLSSSSQPRLVLSERR